MKRTVYFRLSKFFLFSFVLVMSIFSDIYRHPGYTKELDLDEANLEKVKVKSKRNLVPVEEELLQTNSEARSYINGLSEEKKNFLKKAQQETIEFQKELEKRKKPEFYGDPKTNKSKGMSKNTSPGEKDLLASKEPLILSQNTGIYRPGVFYITLEGNSGILKVNGHAAMVLNGSSTLEAFGNQGAANDGVRVWPNDWDSGAFTHFVARSVVGTNTSQDSAAASRAYAQVGKPYNFDLWSIDQDGKYYCSQLVYRQFKYLFGIDLNNEGGPVLPVDLAKTSKAYNIYGK